MPEGVVPVVIVVWFRRWISIVDVYIENVVILLFTWDAGHTKLLYTYTCIRSKLTDILRGIVIIAQLLLKVTYKTS